LMPSSSAWRMVESEAASSCGPQAKAQSPPPIAHVPKPTVVISIPLKPNLRFGKFISHPRASVWLFPIWLHVTAANIMTRFSGDNRIFCAARRTSSAPVRRRRIVNGFADKLLESRAQGDPAEGDLCDSPRFGFRARPRLISKLAGGRASSCPYRARDWLRPLFHVMLHGSRIQFQRRGRAAAFVSVRASPPGFH